MISKSKTTLQIYIYLCLRFILCYINTCVIDDILFYSWSHPDSDSSTCIVIIYSGILARMFFMAYKGLLCVNITVRIFLQSKQEFSWMIRDLLSDASDLKVCKPQRLCKLSLFYFAVCHWQSLLIFFYSFCVISLLMWIT